MVRRIKRSAFAILSVGMMFQAATCTALDVQRLTEVVVTAVVSDLVFGALSVPLP